MVSREKQDLHLTGRGEALTMHYPLLAVVRDGRQRVDKKMQANFHIWETLLYQTLGNLTTRKYVSYCRPIVVQRVPFLCESQVVINSKGLDQVCVWYLPLIASFVSLCVKVSATYNQKERVDEGKYCS